MTTEDGGILPQPGGPLKSSFFPPRCTSLLRVAQVPDDPTTDDRGQIGLLGETVTVLYIGQQIGGQGQLTPGEHRDQTVVAKRTDQAIEGHGGDMVEDRAQFQTEATVRG